MISTFDVSPMPNHMMAGISHAIGGTKRRNWTIGSKSARAKRKRPIARPSGMPTRQPSAKPMPIRRRLTAMSANNMPLRVMSSAASRMAFGDGKSCESSARLASAHATTPTATDKPLTSIADAARGRCGRTAMGNERTGGTVAPRALTGRSGSAPPP